MYLRDEKKVTYEARDTVYSSDLCGIIILHVYQKFV